MSDNLKVLRVAIEKGEFNDFFLGLNGYQNYGRYNPSPISYADNLMDLYHLVEEDKDTAAVKDFEQLLCSICNNVEGIFVSTNYVYILIYHIRSGKCNIPVSITKLVNMLVDAIQKNIDLLKNANEIKRLFVEGNIFEKIAKLSQNCYKDNGIRFIEVESDVKAKIAQQTKL